MIPMLALALCSFLLCLGLTPLFRDIFLRLGLVDRPDAERKVHLRAVPRIGGVPIALSYALALALVVYFSPGSSKLYIQHRELFRELLPAAGLIFLTGLIDDIFGLKPLQKLLGQFLAATLAVSFGARIAFVHLPPWATFVLSLFWLIGCTNAFNLIDGMDGLATGVSLIACLTTAGVAVFSGNIGLALATAPLAGALLAFLRYNFSPASVFLGDCGSLTIGFVLGCFSLIWSQHTTQLWGLAAPLMVIALPLIDVGLSIGRRFIRQVPLFQGDRGHIHHMVLGLGFSTRGAAFVLYGVCGVGALLAVLATFLGINRGWPVLILFCVLVLVGIDRLGYVEWYAARRTLSRMNMREAMQQEIYLMELARTLLYADSADACWSVVRKICSDMNFVSARLELFGSSYSEQFSHPANESSFRIQVHFGSEDYLVVTRASDSSAPRMMYAVLDHLQAAVTEKALLLEFSPKSMTSHAA